jgi:hypothetical protein
MSKPKEKKNIKDVIHKKNISDSDPIPPFDSHDNDKIGRVDSKERV